MGRILVGTASWTDKTLLASGWYPEGASDPASRVKEVHVLTNKCYRDYAPRPEPG